jgi:hypothetical protein
MKTTYRMDDISDFSPKNVKGMRKRKTIFLK